MKPTTLQQPHRRAIKPSWSASELGEKVLGFYAEAATNESQGL